MTLSATLGLAIGMSTVVLAGGADSNDVARLSAPRIIQDDTIMGSVVVDQSGENQTAEITQIDRSIGAGTVAQVGFDGTEIHSTAAIFQQGSQNTASILQDTADNSRADMTQIGNRDLAIISQINAVNLNATIDLAGDEHTASISQSAGADLAAAIYQLGTGHAADIAQSNEFNIANVSQSGKNHIAVISQSGLGLAGFENIATISQAGVLGHRAVITQAGGGNNVATIIQTD